MTMERLKKMPVPQAKKALEIVKMTEFQIEAIMEALAPPPAAAPISPASSAPAPKPAIPTAQAASPAVPSHAKSVIVAPPTAQDKVRFSQLLLVELAASWAIVMVLTGLYLWWPRGRGISGVLWPRLSQGGRTAWRDMHAVTGFWVSGLALVLLLTGLPWAEVWGSSFKAVRAEMGWVKGAQDWTIGGETPVSPDHAEHDHAAMMGTSPAMPEVNDSQIVTEATASLSQMVMLAKQENLAFPVLITPPGAPGRFGKKGADGWTIRSDSQDRTLRTTITYDAKTGQELTRETFADDHVIDRVVGYGVSWHEGQLFGWINQLIGVISALMLVTLSITGFVMWRRRKPQGQLGAPPVATSPTKLKGVAALVFVLAAFLPLLAASLLVMWLVEFLIIRRMANVARWLGMPSDKPHSEDI